jgi:ssDNA-binding Zn-finger/Zn-ribbon topoisomerase 1
MSALVCQKPIATDACPRCGDLTELVETLREELGQLRREVATLRAEAGYWKSRHADTVKRNEQLQAELHQARGEIRQLKARLFGRKSERRSAGQDLAKLVEDEGSSPPRKRGGQPGHRGHRRIDCSHLPASEEIHTLPVEERRCERCGKPRLEMTDTEDSEQIEIEVRAHRRVIRRKRYRWWLWVVVNRETVVYLLDPSCSHDVPEEHFSQQASGILLVDRYSAYKAMSQVKLGSLLLAFCWSHVRRDFLEVGKGFEEWVPWAMDWLRRIRDVYRTNRQRIAYETGSKEFIEHDVRLPEQLAEMHQQAEEELADAKLRLPCRKVLESLKNHWEGLVRFVDRPEIPMDNNGSERILRNPALGRKNYYGSGSLWSGRLTATMFSILATLGHWNLNPRAWLTWYFDQCAASSGKAPADIEAFLPWNFSEEQLAALRITPTEVPLLDSS